MCLSIPGKIIEIKEREITIDYGFEKRKVNLSMIDNLKVGDYIIVSNKIIIATVPKEKAKKFLELIK